MFIVNLISIKYLHLKNNSNNILKRFFLFLSMFLLTFYKLLSQDISFTDPYSDKIIFSPAYSGLSDCSVLNLNYNKNFTSNYFSASYNKYFNKYKTGAGFIVKNNTQAKGAINDINISFIYSYKIALTKKSLINTAIQTSYLQQNINAENLIFNNQINPITGNISINNTEYLFDTYKDINFSIATTYISNKYRTGIVIKHIDKIFNKNNTLKINPYLKLHFAKTFFKKNKKTLITPEIIYTFQDNFNEITYGIHIVNNIFLTRFFIKHNINFNTISAIITLGINLKNVRISYSYSISQNKILMLPNSSNQISILYKFNCKEKRNHKKAIFCSKF